MTSPKLNKKKSQFLLLEVLAIVFGLLYTILYINEMQVCFVFAVLGASIYAYLCYKKKIFAEVFLQLFYIPMAIYGWYNWDEYGTNSYSLSFQLLLLGFTIIVMLSLGLYLKKKTESKSPYLDSFTTNFSLTGTWLMVNFIHEMWLYFIAINAVSIFLYYHRGMKLSVFLYAFYVYLSIAGWYKCDLTDPFCIIYNVLSDLTAIIS